MTTELTNRARKYIDRLQARADVLRARVIAAEVQDLSGETAELAALEWAIGRLKNDVGNLRL